LRLPGVAPRLRVAWIERHDFRTKRTNEDSVSLENVLTETLSFRRCRGLSKNAHSSKSLHGTTSLNAASCYPRNLRPVRDVMKIKSSTLLLALLFAISAAAQTPP